MPCRHPHLRSPALTRCATPMLKTRCADNKRLDEWVGDYDKVIKYLDTNMKSYLTVRNFLNALIVLILNNDKYKDALVSYQNKRDEYNDKYQQSQENGEMTSKQKENWVSLDEINQFVTEMNDEAKHLKLRKDLSVGNLKLLQDRFMVYQITKPKSNMGLKPLR
eukprot:COSAG01_NODE_1133_length_11566_cov_25.815819_14_plen_164_part_00